MGIAEAALLLAAIAGVAGTILPLLPGVGLTMAAALLYAWWTQFRVLTGGDLAILALLTALAFGSDFLLGAGGARRFGASRAGMIGAVIGLFVGLPLLGPIGILAGPVAGAALAEYFYGAHWRQAVRVGIGAGVGTVLATLARLEISVAMLLYIVWQIFWG